MLILIDQREKPAYRYDFASVKSPVLPFTTQVVYLKTGDYQARLDVEGGEQTSDTDSIVIERKTLSDLYSTLSQGRARLNAEFMRMANFGYAALVIEADWSAIANPNDVLCYPTELNPKSVIATLIAWSQRYGVHVFPCPNRNFAEQLTFRMLERWVRDRFDVAADRVPF